jgi:hypothetical protein
MFAALGGAAALCDFTSTNHLARPPRFCGCNKRTDSMSDGRIYYYLLHIKPSKFDRARVIPIGDGLGRVLAEIIR